MISICIRTVLTRGVIAAVLFAANGGNVAAEPPVPALAALEREVAATERAFARTTAERDHAANDPPAGALGML